MAQVQAWEESEEQQVKITVACFITSGGAGRWWAGTWLGGPPRPASASLPAPMPQGLWGAAISGHTPQPHSPALITGVGTWGRGSIHPAPKSSIVPYLPA